MGFMAKAVFCAGALALLKGIDNRLEITARREAFSNLPESFDGFKIAHISDLHSEVPTELFDVIKGLAPDMIAVTGDIIHDDMRSFDGVVELLEKLSKVAPVYIVSGNHDLWNSRFGVFLKKAEAAGVNFLDDNMALVEKNGESIALFGFSDPFGKSTDSIRKSLERSFSALVPFDGFKILLFHRANLFPRLTGKGFDLILAGHMHGGQIRVRGFGGLFPPKSSIIDSKTLIFPKYTEGVYKDGSSTMIVSRGIGNPMILPRLYNRPEVGIITLKKQS